MEIDLSQKTMTAGQLYLHWVHYQKLREENPEMFGLKSTGLASLDYILGGGVEFGQYVLVGGAQKGGKTTLLKHMAQSYGEQVVNSIFFSAEMTNLQIGTMFISGLTQIERSRIRAIGLKVEDWDKIHEVQDDLEKLTLTFNYGFSTVNDMNTIIEETEKELERPVRAIFGDYIHLMEAPNIRANRQEQIAYISRRLKLMSISREWPMAVFMAAQLNRESVKGTIIEMTSFLGSGQLERDMDIGMIIHSINDDDGQPLPNTKQISVVGSRETDIGDCRVAYNGATASVDNYVKIVQEKKKGAYWQP